MDSVGFKFSLTDTASPHVLTSTSDVHVIIFHGSIVNFFSSATSFYECSFSMFNNFSNTDDQLFFFHYGNVLMRYSTHKNNYQLLSYHDGTLSISSARRSFRLWVKIEVNNYSLLKEATTKHFQRAVSAEEIKRSVKVFQMQAQACRKIVFLWNS